MCEEICNGPDHIKTNNYWHITPTKNVESILKYGILPSKDGHFGDGVYCIKVSDYNSLQVILNADMYNDSGFTFEELSIIEFFYEGNVEKYIPVITGYRDEEWILVKEEIPANQIIKVRQSQEFLNLKNECKI